MKYHVNELGEAKPCKASAKECPLGEFMGRHYPSKHTAQKAYSTRVEELMAEAEINGKLLKSSKKELDRLEKVYKELLQSEDTEALTKAFREFREQALVYGRVFRDSFVLNGRKAEMGLEKFKELPKPWSAYPYKFDPKVYYPTRWGKMEFHHGLPEDLKGLLAKELAAFSDYSYQEAYEKVDGYPAYEAAERQAGREPLERDSYVVSLFQEGAANQRKDRVFIDLETTGFDPRVGEIIEIGIVRITAAGDIKERLEERFDLESPEYRDTRGVGPTEVHKIAAADIQGKRKFSDSKVQELVGRYVNDPEVVLGAHNDSFERKYLNLHLDGFWENHSTATAEQRHRNGPLQDTMLISTFLEHSTENNRLQSFTEGNGVPYENAHSALADAEMTAKAYVNFRNKLTALPLGQRPLPQEPKAPTS